MKQLNYDDYLNLRKNAKVIEKDSYGDKVLLREDGRFIKLFRRKRFFSSALLYPYAQRFANNAQKLKELGIPCPEVIAVYRVSSIKRDLVYYHPLAGQTVRQVYQSGQANNSFRDDLMQFIKRVQDAGIYFRSMHLANIIYTPDGKFGLIDFADMKIRKKPLSAAHRERNKKHIYRYQEDANWLNSK